MLLCVHHYLQRHCIDSAGMYPHVANSPLAEQKNSVLRKLESQLAYMDQLTSLQYLRIVLYRMNRVQVEASAGRCFYQS